jgi:hypothetical protein
MKVGTILWDGEVNVIIVSIDEEICRAFDSSIKYVIKVPVADINSLLSESQWKIISL